MSDPTSSVEVSDPIHASGVTSSSEAGFMWTSWNAFDGEPRAVAQEDLSQDARRQTGERAGDALIQIVVDWVTATTRRPAGYLSRMSAMIAATARTKVKMTKITSGWYPASHGERSQVHEGPVDHLIRNERDEGHGHHGREPEQPFLP